MKYLVLQTKISQVFLCGFVESIVGVGVADTRLNDASS